LIKPTPEKLLHWMGLDLPATHVSTGPPRLPSASLSYKVSNWLTVVAPGWLKAQAGHFFPGGISKLVEIYKKCLNCYASYVKKLRKVVVLKCIQQKMFIHFCVLLKNKQTLLSEHPSYL